MIAIAPVLSDERHSYYGRAKRVLITLDDFAALYDQLREIDFASYALLGPSRYHPAPNGLGEALSWSIDGSSPIHISAAGMIFDDEARTPLLTIADAIRRLQQERITHPAVPGNFSLDLSLVDENGTDAYSFAWSGSSGEVRHNDVTRPASVTDRDALWSHLLTQSILDRDDWSIGFEFSSEEPPHMFPRYGLKLLVDGAQVVAFDINAPYFTAQVLFEEFRSWIDERVLRP